MSKKDEISKYLVAEGTYLPGDEYHLMRTTYSWYRAETREDALKIFELLRPNTEDDSWRDFQMRLCFPKTWNGSFPVFIGYNKIEKKVVFKHDLEDRFNKLKASYEELLKLLK